MAASASNIFFLLVFLSAKVSCSVLPQGIVSNGVQNEPVSINSDLLYKLVQSYFPSATLTREEEPLHKDKYHGHNGNEENNSKEDQPSQAHSLRTYKDSGLALSQNYYQTAVPERNSQQVIDGSLVNSDHPSVEKIPTYAHHPSVQQKQTYLHQLPFQESPSNVNHQQSSFPHMTTQQFPSNVYQTSVQKTHSNVYQTQTEASNAHHHSVQAPSNKYLTSAHDVGSNVNQQAVNQLTHRHQPPNQQVPLNYQLSNQEVSFYQQPASELTGQGYKVPVQPNQVTPSVNQQTMPKLATYEYQPPQSKTPPNFYQASVQDQTPSISYRDQVQAVSPYVYQQVQSEESEAEEASQNNPYLYMVQPQPQPQSHPPEDPRTHQHPEGFFQTLQQSLQQGNPSRQIQMGTISVHRVPSTEAP